MMFHYNPKCVQKVLLFRWTVYEMIICSYKTIRSETYYGIRLLETQ